MQLSTRKWLDRLFSFSAYSAIGLMMFVLVLVIGPIFMKGFGAYVFQGTIDYRRMMLNQFTRGDEQALEAEWMEVKQERTVIYAALSAFEKELDAMTSVRRKELKPAYKEVKEAIAILLGPEPGTPLPALPRRIYGQTRWARAQLKAKNVLFAETWDYSGNEGKKVMKPRELLFKDTALAVIFPKVRNDLEKLMRPRLTIYPQFLTDKAIDAHFFGGIGAEVMGTIYLALGAMLIAVPLGVIAAIYFQEYAKEGPVLSFLRSCVNTLAGVPSVVFGLFGLAFFINTLRVSPGKSVLAGALTLALLVLPTVIRASEEAIAAVPRTYKEAALSLGAGKWRTILTVMLPAALPGILTGIVISMGRAAGETAPIIFTAAVSVGPLVLPAEVFTTSTPALSWNLYNICTEHEAVDEIRHVQYGMAATLVLIVLALNALAIVIRAKVSRTLKG
jgi:phosphate transport system permease protein